jgi:oligopeptide/dipeptide ABC transporter ATP-binding protein
MQNSNILEVESLAVRFGESRARAVDEISFGLAKGETLGIAGESGSGKTASILSILGLLQRATVKGSAKFEGRELIGADNKLLNEIRGKRIGLVLQDPFAALDPVKTVGHQISEGLRASGWSKKRAMKHAIHLLEEVGVPSASQRVNAYPHQFSGGMRQRVVIAMALAQDPDVLIADEPTTALDVRIQKQVLDLMKQQCENRGMSLVIITHDLGVISNYTDRIIIMYAGKIVEESNRLKLFDQPLHPYTQGLLDCLPNLGNSENEYLKTIGGQPPIPGKLPSGCRYHPRCSFTEPVCTQGDNPQLVPVKWGRSACIQLEKFLRESQ